MAASLQFADIYNLHWLHGRQHTKGTSPGDLQLQREFHRGYQHVHIMQIKLRKLKTRSHSYGAKHHAAALTFKVDLDNLIAATFVTWK